MFVILATLLLRHDHRWMGTAHAPPSPHLAPHAAPRLALRRTADWSSTTPRSRRPRRRACRSRAASRSCRRRSGRRALERRACFVSLCDCALRLIYQSERGQLILINPRFAHRATFLSPVQGSCLMIQVLLVSLGHVVITVN